MKIAKIILGAKNTDIPSLINLIEIYATAGADIFDVSADKEVITNAKLILTSLNLQIKPKICASITLDNDLHSYKANINNEKCVKCKKCIQACPQNSIIFKNNLITIYDKSCTGCKQCYFKCENKAIDLLQVAQSFSSQFEAAKETDIIEIHTNGHNKNLYDVFSFLSANYTGEISICISNNNNTKEKIKIIEQVKKIISPKKLIVQADGNSISGLNNNIETTRKAVEECKNLQQIQDITLIASGGTNEQTNHLAELENIHIDGIAWGSYARKLVKNTQTKKQQINSAKKLINTIKN